jgi:transcriptional regulator with XRE-family HTH domain
MPPHVKLDIVAIGQRASDRRDELGLDQVQVATASGMSRAYISRLENGIVSNPKVADLASIAEALRLSLDQLIYGHPTGSLDVDLPNLLKRRLGPELGEAVAGMDMALATWEQRDINAAVVVLESISARHMRRGAEQRRPTASEN